MNVRRSLIALLFAGFLLSACAVVPGSPAGETPVAPVVATLPPQDAPIQPPAGALQAQRQLAEQLGIDVSAVQIAQIDQVEWPNACLGLEREGMNCAQVITPGFRVILEAGGQQYEYRTNLDGSQVRAAGVEQAGQDTDLEILRRVMARRLGVAPSEVQVGQPEAVEWSDACLGYQHPAELCAAAVTPGFRVIVSAGGNQYEVRTDAGFTRARLPGGEELPLRLPENIRAAVARELGTAAGDLQVLFIEKVEWPDSCMGVEAAGTACAEVVTPGYRVLAQAGEQRAEVRVNAEGSQAVRVNDAPVFTWKREGGVAGFCDELEVLQSGLLRAYSCKEPSTLVIESQLGEQQQAQLAQWTAAYRSFEFEQTDPASADGMRVSMKFSGQGQRQATQAEMALVQQMAAELFAQLPR